MEETLKYILSDITEWLKFAETKAATLVAGNGLVIFGVLRVIDIDALTLLSATLLFICLGQLSLSLIICIVSFIPSISKPWLFKTEEVGEEDNLLYYMHIAKYKPDQYIAALDDSKEITKLEHTRYEMLFARQIIEISIVTRRKFKLLNISLWLTLSSVITPIGAYLLFKAKRAKIKNI
jgi:Pycsar effector protein